MGRAGWRDRGLGGMCGRMGRTTYLPSCMLWRCILDLDFVEVFSGAYYKN